MRHRLRSLLDWVVHLLVESRTFSFSDEHTFLLFLGAFVFFLLVLSNCLTILAGWLSSKFYGVQAGKIGSRLLSHYLRLPYTFFLGRNTSEMLHSINNAGWHIMNDILQPLMKAFFSLVSMILILGMLLYVDKYIAFTMMATFGTVGILFIMLVGKKTRQLGEDNMPLDQCRQRMVLETLGGAKELKLVGNETVAINRYADIAHRYYMNNAILLTIPTASKYLFEMLGFGGIVLILIYTVRGGGDTEQAVPIIAMYTFAAYRMMPMFHVISGGFVRIRQYLPFLDAVHDVMSLEVSTAQINDAFNNRERTVPLSYSEKIEFQNVSFTYPGAESPSISELNVMIPHNSTLGIVGTTGAGKTTMVDILLSLLFPDTGKLLVDGVEIVEDNVRNWQKCLGYVPQAIFLTDDSVAQNIAFGVPNDKIDIAAVERAAKIANIHEFVISELPKGYQAIVGERGIRLSGGQRQRIGIARALYYNPAVLILDEATSALDGISEDVIMDAIHNLSHKKTIVIIAHRMTTVKECDVIFMLENGRLVDKGSYLELNASNAQFREMAGGSSLK